MPESMVYTKCSLFNKGPQADQYQPKSTLENLSRLASKQGVQATLVLSRKDGAIVQSTGLAVTASPEPASLSENRSPQNDGEQQTSTPQNAASDLQYAGSEQVNQKSAEDIARRVFALVSSSHDLADAMDNGSDVQLLRMRSHRREVVIVPGSSSQTTQSPLNFA
jgi:dynein light chain roadblock-type